MSIHTLLLLLAIHAAALISPGPDFAVVTRLAIVGGRRSGLMAAAGVASAIGLYVLLCAFGLTLIIAALPGLSRLLSVVGAGYLLWLGVQCLRSRGQLPTGSATATGRRAYLNGLLTNLLNPKAMLYFGSILSQVLTPGLGGRAVLLVWVLLVLESFAWFALVATVFSSRRVLDRLKARLVWLDRAIGVVLLALAAKLATLAAR
jgi:threonine/homoserine/homoserine lactone efflux protein